MKIEKLKVALFNKKNMILGIFLFLGHFSSLCAMGTPEGQEAEPIAIQIMHILPVILIFVIGFLIGNSRGKKKGYEISKLAEFNAKPETAAVLFCTRCGKQLTKGSKFCDGCGASV